MIITREEMYKRIYLDLINEEIEVETFDENIKILIRNFSCMVKCKLFGNLIDEIEMEVSEYDVVVKSSEECEEIEWSEDYFIEAVEDLVYENSSLEKENILRAIKEKIENELEKLVY